jgi:hypothetical protein
MSEELVSDKCFIVFQEKVNKVNGEIEAGLFNLEKMIAELKRKKVEESQIQSKIKAAERVRLLEREFQERREEFQLRQRQEQAEQEREAERLKQELTRQQRQASPIKGEESPNISTKLIADLIEKEKRLQESIERSNSPVKHR